MTKSKTFWAASALISLAVMVFAGYSLYGRVAMNFSGGPIEVRPVPMPPPQEQAEGAKEEDAEEAPAAEEKTAKTETPAAATAPADAARVKAVKTVFEYRDAKAKSVNIAGSFTSWKAKKMTRKDGVWKTEIYILPGTYPYHYTVDGKKKQAPGKPKAPTGDSLITVE